MCMKKHVLIFKEKFANWLNMGLPPWVEKTVYEVEIHWLSSKEKVPGAAVIKGGHADSLLGCESAHHYWFHLEKKLKCLTLANNSNYK